MVRVTRNAGSVRNAAGSSIAIQLQDRTPAKPAASWTCAPLQIDTASREVRCGGRLLRLTSRETDILIELYQAQGNPLSQAMLWERCWIGKGWSHAPAAFANTVDQAIKRLRKSLTRQCPDIPGEYHPLVCNVWARGFALRNLAKLGEAR